MKKIIGLVIVLAMVAGILTSADQKVSSLTTATAIQDTNYFYLVQTTSKKVAASTVQDYVLDGGTIAGNSAGDIVTVDGTQTLTNKTLTAPVLGGTAVTADGAELNIMDGATISTTELNYLDSLRSNVQDQIDAIANASAPTRTAYQYTLAWVQSGTTKDITEATILADIGDPAHYVVAPVIEVALWAVSSGSYEVPTYTVKYTVQGAEISHLDTISLTELTNAVNYALVVTYRLINDQNY